MAVKIEMEMPENCEKCKISYLEDVHYTTGTKVYVVCPLLENSYGLKTKRRKDCPLKKCKE